MSENFDLSLLTDEQVVMELRAGIKRQEKEVQELRKIITELCDALEKWCVPMRHGESKLIERAREAAK